MTGYFIGQGSSLGFFKTKGRKSWPNSYNVKVHRDSSDDEASDEESEDESEDEGDGSELATLKDSMDEVKLVLVVRTDLGMTKGISFSSSFSLSYAILFCSFFLLSQQSTVISSTV